MSLSVQWDLRKAEANWIAHGVRFADVVAVLEDEFALTREDPDVQGERRFVTLGSSAAGAILVVVYTHREPDGYRIISAWKANRRQRALYEEGRR